MAAVKKLYKSTDDKMISGVCGGVAEYFNLDATLIRLGWVLLVVVTGFFPGILAYIVMAIIIPEKEDVQPPKSSVK